MSGAVQLQSAQLPTVTLTTGGVADASRHVDVVMTSRLGQDDDVNDDDDDDDCDDDTVTSS